MRWLLLSLLALFTALLCSVDHRSLVNALATRLFRSASPRRAYSGMAMNVSRAVVSQTLAVEQDEGAGARVRRSIGTSRLRNWSPFLMLDHFKVPMGAGFPDHPHRGQTTVTYMLAGKFQHEDSKGHAGIIGPGDLQFMQAGRGIVHSEMPLVEDDILPEGLQLWVDLPAANKNDPCDYQELRSEEIPVAHPEPGVTIKVISGTAQGNEEEGLVISPVKSKAPCLYYDIALAHKGATAFQALPADYRSFIYTISGKIEVEGQSLDPYYTVILTNEDGQTGVRVTASTDDARFLLIAGQPLDQEIVQYGPFVLSSEKDVRQAFLDYRNGENGFEDAPHWRSKIGAALRG